MLKERLERQGDFIFRWRGWIPLLGLPILAYELFHFSYLMGSHRLDVVIEVLCFTVAGVGLAIRALVHGYAPSGTSGRNARRQRARELNTTGMYSLCRNPLYLGNYLISAGVLLFFASPYLLALFSLLFWLYYERIILREEAFLSERFGERYRAWARRTPVFLPRLSGWEQPERPFRLRTVLRREYTTVFTIAAVLTSFEVLGDLAIEGRFTIEPAWLGILSLASLQYVVLRTLKKHTRLLRA